MTNETKKPQVIWRQGKKVILRPLESTDIAPSRVWINDPENNQYLTKINPTSEYQQQKWYESVQSGDGRCICVAICLHDGTLIGNTALEVDYIKRSGATGTLIGSKKHQGNGYAVDAKMLMLDYAFNWLGLRKVTSVIFDFNRYSMRYADKCGYRHMATIEQEHFRYGRWADELHYVVFRDEWLPLWEEYKKDL